MWADYSHYSDKDVFMDFVLKTLPPDTDLETTSVLRKGARVHPSLFTSTLSVAYHPQS